MYAYMYCTCTRDIHVHDVYCNKMCSTTVVVLKSYAVHVQYAYAYVHACSSATAVFTIDKLLATGNFLKGR